MNDANATGPEPRTPTWSSTWAASHHALHQRCARLNRSGPEIVNRAASPQPTKPAPSRTQAWPPEAGSRASSSSSIPSRVTVRTTRPWVVVRNSVTGQFYPGSADPPPDGAAGARAPAAPAVARCSATIPPERLRQAGLVHPAAAIWAASSGCVGHARIDSAR